MGKTEDLSRLVDAAMMSDTTAHMRPVIAKELLHYDILFALDKASLLDKLTFQGGTSLRLCYGAVRFSEDLDFVGGKEFVTADLMAMKHCLEQYVSERYGLDITVKEPREMASISEYKDLKVDKWQIRITTAAKQKDVPKQRIKIEVANVPAYSREPLSLKINYDFLPDGYSDTLVMTETLEEIMADKLISLVSCQRYVRHRDIWDLRWLTQQGAKIRPEYIQAKIKDYRIDNYPELLTEMIARVDNIIRSKGFHDEMSRFIPVNVQQRTLLKPKFIEYLISETQRLLQQVEKILQGSHQGDEFSI